MLQQSLCVIYTPISFDIFMSPSDSLNQYFAKLHTYFQFQLLKTQYLI